MFGGWWSQIKIWLIFFFPLHCFSFSTTERVPIFHSLSKFFMHLSCPAWCVQEKCQFLDHLLGSVDCTVFFIRVHKKNLNELNWSKKVIIVNTFGYYYVNVEKMCFHQPDTGWLWGQKQVTATTRANMVRMIDGFNIKAIWEPRKTLYKSNNQQLLQDLGTHCQRGRCQRSTASAPGQWRSHLRSAPRSSSAPGPAPFLPAPPPDERWPPATEETCGERERARWRMKTKGSQRCGEEEDPARLPGTLAALLMWCFLSDTRLRRILLKDWRRDFFMLFTLDRGPSMASWSLGLSVHLEITVRQVWHYWSAWQLPLCGSQTGHNLVKIIQSCKQ